MKLTERVEPFEPGQINVRDVEIPEPGENDVLVRVRACGICGSDVTIIGMGGRGAAIPLGHEPAGEVVEVGKAVVDIHVGDRVVVNPIAAPSGIMGNGGALGALTEYLLIESAILGVSLNRIPDSLPFSVAALNEPMAVARHFVNRANPRTEETAIIFGAGPIGLGAAIWLKLGGVKHVVVAGRHSKAAPTGIGNRCRRRHQLRSTRRRRRTNQAPRCGHERCRSAAASHRHLL